MTYYINSVELDEVFVSNRRTADKWNIKQQAAENVPYIEQTGQGPTNFNLNIALTGATRYDMVTSIRAEIRDCEKILIQSTDKCLYGNQQYVWLAQSNLNVTESGNKRLAMELSGQIDPYQIHSCDFLKDWSGTSLSLDTAHDGKHAIKDTITSYAEDTTYDATYNPGWTVDIADKNYLCFWMKADQPSSAYTITRAILLTSADNYYYWDTTFNADVWTFMECDLNSPDGTVGSPSLTNITQFILRVVYLSGEYYFNAYDTNNAWEITPGGMVNGNLSGKALSYIDDDLQILDGNTCDGTDLGTITKVELRVYGRNGLSHTENQILQLIPYFDGTDEGDAHDFTVDNTEKWSSYFDITNDTNAPPAWDWDDVANLDCKVYFRESDIDSAQMNCSQVDINVTYSIPSPPASLSRVVDNIRVI